MVVVTLSLVQKGQTSGCNGRSTQWTQWNSGIWLWGHCLWCKKVKPVNSVDAVHSGHSGIVIYGGGDIVFGAKRSNQWTQWMQYAVDTVHSGIVVYGGGNIVIGTKRSTQWIQWTQSHSGHSTQWTQWMQYTVELWYMVVGTLSLMQKRSNQWMKWTQYAVDTVDAVE